MVRYIKVSKGKVGGLGIGFSRTRVVPLPEATQINPLPIAVANRFETNQIYPEREEEYDVVAEDISELYVDTYERAVRTLTNIINTRRDQLTSQKKRVKQRLINEAEREMMNLWRDLGDYFADESGRQRIINLINQARQHIM